MLIVHILIVAVVTGRCDAEFGQTVEPHSPDGAPEVLRCMHESVTTQSNEFNGSIDLKEPLLGLQFRQPFVDLEIQNDRNVHVMRELDKQRIFVLHGHELFQLFVGRSEKGLSLMGYLDGNIRHEEPLGVEVISWHAYLLFVVAFEEHMDVYQISEDSLKQREAVIRDPQRADEEVPHFEDIQQLTLVGKYRKLFLFAPSKDRIMLLVALDFTKVYGRFRSYEWSRTYFDPVEELTVPPIHVISVVGTYPKYIVAARLIQHQIKTILTVYEVSGSRLQLRPIQTLTVASRTVHTATFGDRNYMIVCTKQQQHKCNIFRQMGDGQFNVYQQRSSEELAFDRFAAGSRYLIAARREEVLVFTNQHLDCYRSFRTNETDLMALMAYTNGEREDFVVLIYKRPSTVLIRMVEIELADESLGAAAEDRADRDDPNRSTHLFEDSIGRLRSVLLKRKLSMDAFRKVTAVVHPKLKQLKVKNAVRLHKGNVGIIRVVNKDISSPLQLLQRVKDIRTKYQGRRLRRSYRKGPHNITLDLPTRLNVKRLHVDNLLYEDNVLDGFQLELLPKSSPILSIRPAVTTHSLHSAELVTPQNPRSLRQAIPIPDLGSPVRVRQLNITTINQMSWHDLYEELFLKNTDSKIRGNLVFQDNVDVVDLKTPSLNGVSVEHLFNLRQPQVIHSNLVISRVRANEMQAEKVNGLSFEQDIVFSGTNAFVETPVIMTHLSIANDLFLAHNTKAEPTTTSNGHQEVELKQFYTNKVIINGSLTLSNLATEDRNRTKLLVGDEHFSFTDLKARYLLQRSPQVFDKPITIHNSRIRVASLNTSFLNGHPTEEHLLRSGSKGQQPLAVVLMEAHIDGDLISRDHVTQVAEFNANAVRAGEAANITGVKIFKAPLEVDSLMTLSLNEVPVSDLVLKPLVAEVFCFKGRKSFERLLVNSECYVEKELNARFLNNLPLKELLNYDYHFDWVRIPHTLHAVNVIFDQINGISFNEVFSKLSTVHDKLVLHKDLLVEGNVEFAGNLQLQQINDLRWDEYVNSLVRFNEDAVISGRIRFLSDLTINKELMSPAMNNVNLSAILPNILRRSKPQLITGEYSFANLNVSHLDVGVINDISTASLIDLRQPNITIDGDIITRRLKVSGNVRGDLRTPFRFESLPQRLMALSQRPWKRLVVLGNAHWNATKSVFDRTAQAQLNYLYKNAVSRVRDQTITGNVRLQSPLITKMITTSTFPKDIDLNFIAKDCLFKNTSKIQVIDGAKTFLRPLLVERAEGVKGFHTKVFNKIDILHLNASLYRRSSGELIGGPLYFRQPPTVGVLYVEGLVNGARSSNLYQLTDASVLPPLRIRHLLVDDQLEVDSVNGMSLDYLLDNRVRKHGPALEVSGFLTFENLVLNKEILLKSINDISIDNLVFKRSKHLQALVAPKRINGNLVLDGPAHVMRLNGRDVMDTYRSTLFTDHDYQFEKLTLEKATFEGGLQLVQHEPEYHTRGRTPSDDLEHSSRLEKFQVLRRDLEELEKKADRGQKLLYLDYDDEVDVEWESPSNLSVAQHIQRTFDILRVSFCERQLLQVTQTATRPHFYLRNITTNIMTSSVDGLAVKAENYCKHPSNNVLKSKVTITGHKLLKVFGMRRHIENIGIYHMRHSGDYFIVLHALDAPLQMRNEVRILKLNNKANTISEWQAVTQGIGSVMRFVQFADFAAFLSSATSGRHPALSIYHFVSESQKFRLVQTLDGDYDLIEMVHLRDQDKYQVILSRRHCQRISVYEMEDTASSHPYELFQIIKSPTPITKLFTVTLGDDLYLLVLSEDGQDYYHLYRYEYVQGWRHVTYGYFRNIQKALPLADGAGAVDSVNPELLIVCGSANCRLVRSFGYH